MTINPRDYDLNELRKMAKQDDPGNRFAEEQRDDPAQIDVSLESASEDVTAGRSFRAGLYRELLPFMGDGAEKPYLESLPTTYSAEMVIFEWLEFLSMHSGHRGTIEALDYYASIDWVTDDVRSELSDYLLGVDESSSHDGNDLDVDDHLLSLVYVAKLRSMD